jgi:hypothetical protein
VSEVTFDPPRHQRPRPNPTRFTEPFWEGTRRGVLLVQRCRACGDWRWTPQLACPRCWSEDAEWAETRGRGTVYSYTAVVHRAVDPARFRTPYVLAVVQLDEGPHLLTNIVECDPDAVHIDMPVAVRFERLDDEFVVYPFAPARERTERSRVLPGSEPRAPEEGA